MNNKLVMTLLAGWLAFTLPALGQAGNTSPEEMIKLAVNDPEAAAANPIQALHVYRITQEAVANALLHGAATAIRIGLKLVNDEVWLEVANNGHDWPSELAVPATPPGMGLNIMAYRARMLSGTLQIRRGNSGGTMVELSFPVQRPP